jgi:hypothetical protein
MGTEKLAGSDLSKVFRLRAQEPLLGYRRRLFHCRFVFEIEVDAPSLDTVINDRDAS